MKSFLFVLQRLFPRKNPVFLYPDKIKTETLTSAKHKEAFMDYKNLSNEDAAKMLASCDWTCEGEKTVFLSHNLHPYPAKFIPQIPASAIEMFSEKGDTVWDIFGGSGTTALEAMMRGRNCISTDLNPVGYCIGMAKTAVLDKEDKKELENIISELGVYESMPSEFTKWCIENAVVISTETPAIPKLDKWFCKDAVNGLAFLKWYIKRQDVSDNVKNVLTAAFSRTVNLASNQEGETYYRAVEKTLSDGETVSMFLKSLRTNVRKIQEMNDALPPQPVPSIRFVVMDVSEEISDDYIRENSIDLIVTSPPYPKALDYCVYHRFRLFWLGYNPRLLRKREIGSHLNYQQKGNDPSVFEEEMLPVMKNAHRALKKGHFAVFVLGDAMYNGEIYNTAEKIGTLAEKEGFDIVWIGERPLPEHKRFNQIKKKRMVSERILVLKKR